MAQLVRAPRDQTAMVARMARVRASAAQNFSIFGVFSENEENPFYTHECIKSTGVWKGVCKLNSYIYIYVISIKF